MIEPSYRYDVEMVSVYDGDTVTVNISLGFYSFLKKQKVRLIGIDTPEIRGIERPAGLIARDYLRGLLLTGNRVVMQSTQATSRRLTGKYGRWLGRFWVREGQDWLDVNKSLLEKGYATEYLK